MADHGGRHREAGQREADVDRRRTGRDGRSAAVRAEHPPEQPAHQPRRGAGDGQVAGQPEPPSEQRQADHHHGRADRPQEPAAPTAASSAAHGGGVTASTTSWSTVRSLSDQARPSRRRPRTASPSRTASDARRRVEPSPTGANTTDRQRRGGPRRAPTTGVREVGRHALIRSCTARPWRMAGRDHGVRSGARPSPAGLSTVRQLRVVAGLRSSDRARTGASFERPMPSGRSR